MSNYFHDVATAMLLACCIVLGVFLRKLGNDRDETVLLYAAALYRGVSAMFWFSVLWIIASGILRVMTFRSFEWAHFSGKHLEAGLLVKYGIAFVMMIVGAFLWVRSSRLMKRRLNS